MPTQHGHSPKTHITMQTTDLFAQFNGIANRVFSQEYNRIKNKLKFSQEPKWVTLYQVSNVNPFDGSGMLSVQINLNNREAQELQGNFQEALTREVQNIFLTVKDYSEPPCATTNKINDFSVAVTATVYNDQPFAWATIGGSDTSIMLQVQVYWQ